MHVQGGGDGGVEATRVPRLEREFLSFSRENNLVDSKSVWLPRCHFVLMPTASNQTLTFGTLFKHISPLTSTLSWEPRTQKLKSHPMRTQSLKVLLFKPGVDQYFAVHAALTARDFFLANFDPSCPFTCIFSKTSPKFSLC